MTKDDNKTPGGGLSKGFDEKIVEELYRLAEIVQSPDSGARPERKRIAATRMADILRLSSQAYPPQPPLNVEHRWVLEVLLDLVRYTENHNLVSLHHELVEARFKCMQILNSDP